MKYDLKKPIKIATDLSRSCEELLQLNKLVEDKISEIDLLMLSEFQHQFSMIEAPHEFEYLTESCQVFLTTIKRRLGEFRQGREMLVAFLLDYNKTVQGMVSYFEREEANLNKLDNTVV